MKLRYEVAHDVVIYRRKSEIRREYTVGFPPILGAGQGRIGQSEAPNTLSHPGPTPNQRTILRMREQCVAKAWTDRMLDGTEPHEGLSMYTLCILVADGEISSWGRHPR